MNLVLLPVRMSTGRIANHAFPVAGRAAERRSVRCRFTTEVSEHNLALASNELAAGAQEFQHRRLLRVLVDSCGDDRGAWQFEVALPCRAQRPRQGRRGP